MIPHLLPVGFVMSLLLVVGGSVAPVSLDPARAAHTPADTTKPLRPLMIGLAQDMDRVATGLWHEDYDLIEEGARSIANHPQISAEQIAKIKEVLGDQFQGFVAFDKSVHKTATELVDVARARNWSGVLDAHARLQQGCVGCHEAYREQLRPVLTP